MDPVFYYQNYGQANGDSWNCSLCNVNPHYVTEPICNCPEAQRQYMNDYAFLQTTPSTAWQNYLQNTSTGGFAWKCELCQTNVQDPSTSLTCNCSSARALYASTYGVSTDPWNHYISSGKGLGNTWDCGICNDTCPGKYFPGAWTDATQPVVPNQDVTIPAGCFVGLPDSLNLVAANIYIKGVFRCKNSATSSYSISAKKIWLQAGALECGTEAAFFAGRLDITLTGAKPAQGAPDSQGGDKSIAGLRGGTLSLHGAKRSSWTKLATPAGPGDTQITVQDTTDWQVGDVIVIATTDNANYGAPLTTNEVRAITAISGRTLTLNQSLAYTHLCETHNFTFNTHAPLILKKQAEVGLVHGKNIRIQGDAQSDAQGFGAHIMMMVGSRSYISGIQITRGGQQAMLGRYPFHWHLVGDIPAGQYIKSSSISFGYNRCITVHATNNTVVQNNMCYSSIGHLYFLENGVETGNVFDGNLGILAIRPSASQAIIPSDIKNGPHAYGPSIFWISNPNNTFTNNAAVSGLGSAYWYQLESSASGPFAATDYNPSTKPFGLFQNNMAHSITEGYVTCADAGGTSGPSTYNDIWPLRDWVSYGTYIGIWPCGSPQLWENGIISEANIGMQDPTKQYLKNVAFVNYIDGSVIKPTTSVGVFLYDSGWAASDVMFKNYDNSPTYSIFRIVAGNDYDTSTRLQNVTLVNSPSVWVDTSDVTHTGVTAEWGAVVNDVDGTFTGRAGSALTTGHAMVADETCTNMDGAFGKVCPYRYGQPRIQFSGTNLPMGLFGRYNFRTGGGQAQGVFLPPATFPIYRLSTILNTDYVFYFVHPITSTKLQKITMMPFSKYGDTMALEIRNVASLDAISGATQAASCWAVYNNKLSQTYYFNAANNTLCLRLVASSLAFPSYGASGAWGYQGYIILQVTHGTELSTTTAGLTTTTTGSANPYSLSWQCQCLAARYDYWSRYPDVKDYPMDPVYHYQRAGGLEGRTWDCSGCYNEPHWINETFCNCADAQTEFRKQYTSVYSDPFTYFLANWQTSGTAWDCEICPGPTPSATTTGGSNPTTASSTTTTTKSATTKSSTSTSGDADTEDSSASSLGASTTVIALLALLFSMLA